MVFFSQHLPNMDILALPRGSLGSLLFRLSPVSTLS